MNLGNLRARLEKPPFDLSALTAGQWYTAAVVAVITAIVLATGLPDGRLAAGSGIGAIPDLGVGQAGVSAVAPAPADETLLPLPPLDLSAVTTPPVAESGAATSEPAGATNDPPPPPPPTTTTTTVPSPLPVPVPPLPAPPPTP